MNEYVVEHKGFFIKPSKIHASCYEVVTTGQGGKIPDILVGAFTTRTFAITQIEAYIDSRDKKGEKIEKASTGGSK